MQISKLKVMFERKYLFHQKLIQTKIEYRNKLKRNKQNSISVSKLFS